MEKRVSCGMLVNWRPNSQSWNPKKYKTVSADKTYWNLGGKRLYIMMTRDNEWKSYICTVKQWYVVTCFTRVIYIYANSPGLSGSLPHGWPKLPDKRKFGSVALKKLQFSLHLFQNFKIIWLLCLYYGFWLHFLAWCTLFVANKKRRKISCLKSLIDRSTFFPRNWSVGGRGEEEIGSPNQKKIFWGGSHWQIRLGGGGGGGRVPVWKNVSRFEISRDWHLWIWVLSTELIM